MKNLLKLYIIGQTPAASIALENIRAICSDPSHGDWELEVIDVLENPQLAEEDRIIATPTLVKQLPEPVRRFVGDLSNKEQILLGLDIVSSGEDA